MEVPEQVVLITGAAGNLGRAVADAFARRDARLVLLDLRREALAAAYGDENERRVFAPTNLLEQDQVEAAARLAVSRFGRVDAACNIAGAFRMGEPVHATTDANWNFLFDVNARTLLHVARAVVPKMLAAGRGRIVNVGAYAAQRGEANKGAYIAAKSAAIRLTEAMAAELREQGINVNCVLPTIIDTPENRKAMPDADPARWVAPADLAEVIVFLCSEGARAIHGAAIPVAGLS